MRGLPPAARQALVRDLDRLHRLRLARQKQFDHLLAVAGRDLGFTLGPDDRATDLRGDLVDEGIVGTLTPGAAPDDFLVTRAGRIEIFDDRATFTSADGSVAFRTVAGTPGTMPVDGPGALVASEASATVRDVQTTSNDALNPAQAAGLQTAFQSPGQQLVTPADAEALWSHVNKQPDGAADVRFGNGASVVLAPDGTVSAQTPSAALARGARGGGGVGAGGGGGGGGAAPLLPPVPISFTAAALVMLESAASIALATFLLVAGILVLRHSPRGGRLHAAYAWLKIPLAIGGAAAAAWLWWSFDANPAPGGGGGPGVADTNYVITTAALAAIVTCLHPLALLIALRQRPVREYYQAGPGGA